MIQERMQEFIIMLLLENLATNNEDFENYFHKHYDTVKFNNRYKDLLDEFLNEYALNTSEKSV